MSLELCLVCGDRASGRHYGAISCEGCKGFFKRSIRKQLGYQCRGTMNCEVTKHHRNRCQFCRLQKCLASGMRSDSVQHERKPIVEKKETTSPNVNNTSPSSATSSAAVAAAAAAAAAVTINVLNKGSNSEPRSSTSPHSGVPTTTSNYQTKLRHNKQTTTSVTAKTILGTSLNGGNKNGGVPPAATGFFDNTNILPLGINFAELSQTLILASQKQQQQQKSHNIKSSKVPSSLSSPYPTDLSTQQQQQHLVDSDNANNVNINNLMLLEEDDISQQSMDTKAINISNNNNSNINSNNNASNKNFNVSSSSGSATLPDAANTVSMIQKSLDKLLVENALKILTPIRKQIENLNMKYNNNKYVSNPAVHNNSNDNIMPTVSLGEVNYREGDDDDITAANCFSLTGQLTTPEEGALYYQLVGGATAGLGDLHIDGYENSHIFQQDLVTPLQAVFELQTPTLVSTYLSSHYACETVSRIICLSAFWLRKIAAFQELQEQTQIQLLQAGWPAQLTIALAQVRNISLPTILLTLVNNVKQIAEIEKIEPQKIRDLSEHVQIIHTFIQEMLAYELTDMEFALLRLILLFNPHCIIHGRERKLKAFMKRLQLYGLSNLRKYIMDHYMMPEDMAEERFNNLLINLMPLIALKSHIIEELFYASLLGQMRIDNMIPYVLMLRAVGGEQQQEC